MTKRLFGFLFSLFILVLMIPAVAFAWDYDKDDGEKLSDLPNAKNNYDNTVLIITYDGTDDLPNGMLGASWKVHLKPGTYEFSLAHSPFMGDTAPSVFGGLYADKSLMTVVNDSLPEHYAYVKANDEKYHSVVYNVSTEKDYYLAVYSAPGSGTSGTSEVEVYVGFNELYTNKTKLVAGRWYGMYGASSSGTRTRSYTAKKTGELEVQCSANVRVSLKNSSGKVISRQRSKKQWPCFFGVKKGVTYQIEIEDPDDYPTDGYVIHLKNTAKSLSGGANKKKAVSIKRGPSGRKTGVIVAGDSKAKWYKIAMQKKRKLNIAIGGATCDSIKVYLYNSKGTLIASKTRSYKDGYLNWVNLRTPKALAVGTYYVKVIRLNSNSSGWYTLDWSLK